MIAFDTDDERPGMPASTRAPRPKPETKIADLRRKYVNARCNMRRAATDITRERNAAEATRLAAALEHRERG